MKPHVLLLLLLIGLVITAQAAPHTSPTPALDNLAGWVRRAQSPTDTEAHYTVGFMFWLGVNGAPKNQTVAVYWFQKAAQGRGDFATEAAFYLGRFYLQGEGVTRDISLARRWLTVAADAGILRAQSKLAYCYFFGCDDVLWPQDARQAARWMRKAAEQGDIGAQYYLGFIYEEGRGVPQNLYEAYKWYAIAAHREPESAAGKSATQGRKQLAWSLTESQKLRADSAARDWRRPQSVRP